MREGGGALRLARAGARIRVFELANEASCVVSYTRTPLQKQIWAICRSEKRLNVRPGQA